MATRGRALSLHEEVMLLALRNDKGTVAGSVMFTHAAGGALLAELLLAGRARTVTEGRSTYAMVADRTPFRDPVLDDCLERLATARRRRKLLAWVQRFANLPRLKHRVAAGLVAKGVLRETDDRVLLIFTRRVYPELDPSFEQAIIARLDDAIFSDSKPVDPRTTVLVAIAHHTGLLRTNFDKRRLKTRRARIKAIIAGDAVGKATQEAIQAVQAAVMMAAVMPAIMASSSH